MILSRYLTREVFGSLLAVTFVLLLIFLSNQLVRNLSYAASGKLAANILLQLLAFEVPYLLALLLPLGLYLGIILAYGRLYADNELNVMQACGLTQMQLIKITGFFTLFVIGFILILMLWINPLIGVKKGHVLAEGMSTANVIQNLMPGRFQVTSNGRRVVYVENINRNHKVADNVFFADQAKTSSDENAPTAWSVISAARGYQMKDKQSGQHYLVAEDGYRYEGVPGQNNYKVIQFKKYSVQIPGVPLNTARQEKEAMTTLALMKGYEDPSNAAELQWRFAIPISALLLSLLAIPLSHVQPRQGRFSAVLPAILIYVVYVDLLFVARNWVEQKTVSITVGMWWVHLLFLVVVMGFLSFQSTYVKKLLRRA